MSFPAKVFLSDRKLQFHTVWIAIEDRDVAIKALELEKKKPSEIIDISFEGKYEKYTIGKHDIFIAMRTEAEE